MLLYIFKVISVKPCKHFVVFAFYKNGDHSGCMNECVKFYSNSEIYHCEIVIGNINISRNEDGMIYVANKKENEYYIYSIDSKNHVVKYSNRKYKSNKWVFLKLYISKEKEIGIIKSTNRYLNNKFSQSRMFMANWIDCFSCKSNRDDGGGGGDTINNNNNNNNDKKWFCSELLCQILLENDIIKNYVPMNCTPDDIYKALIEVGAKKI